LVKYNFKDIKAPAGTDQGVPIFTLGGLEVRPTGEVLTPDGEVIPGLFAAGRTVAGLPRTCVGYSSGMSVGDATFFGRLAGRTAARANT
jgi:3-oxo-5alpha-steroid 4-dehydrogenase